MTALSLDLEDLPPSHRNAPCWTSGGADLWTSDSKAKRRQAAALCQEGDCPILEDCRTAAIMRGERFGVWGGLDLESEYRDRYRTPKGRPPAECGTPGGYKRHVREGTPKCDPCITANRAKAREARRARKRRSRLQARAEALAARQAAYEAQRERFRERYGWD